MTVKNSLPAMAILMLDTALTTLDRAAEAQSLEDARAGIATAQNEIASVLKLAKQAATEEP
jgi:hypothetical protein